MRSLHALPCPRCLARVTSRLAIAPARLLAGLATAALLTLPAWADETPADTWPYAGWRNDPAARASAQSVLERFNARLLASSSATRTLEEWCGERGLAPLAKIRALKAKDAAKPADDTVRRELGVGPDEVLAYRRVQLTCGKRVLSEADNWYVPARLTAEMNMALTTTDIPFGAAVRDLHFTRQTREARLLWTPTASANIGEGLVPPYEVLRHRAVLKRADGEPFSYVVETYTRELLAFSLDVGQP